MLYSDFAAQYFQDLRKHLLSQRVLSCTLDFCAVKADLDALFDAQINIPSNIAYMNRMFHKDQYCDSRTQSLTFRAFYMNRMFHKDQYCVVDFQDRWSFDFFTFYQYQGNE